MKHIFQPNGISCGPTCIKMASEFANKVIDEIDVICASCGTDSKVGTPPDKMIIGLNKYEFNYKIHMDTKTPFNNLKEIINNGSIGILRTITKEIPHWIIVKSYNDNIYDVYDPWLGKITYTEKELDSIWKVRNYFFFEIKK